MFDYKINKNTTLRKLTYDFDERKIEVSKIEIQANLAKKLIILTLFAAIVPKYEK